MNYVTTLVSVIFLASLVPTLAGADTTSAVVMRVDHGRLNAMMEGNARALANVFSETLRFVHSDGRIESKAEYVRNMTAGDTAYTEVRTSDITSLEPAPTVVILMGAQHMRKRLGDTWSDIGLRFMSVWRDEGGTWRMVAWQSMKPSGSSVVPTK